MILLSTRFAIILAFTPVVLIAESVEFRFSPGEGDTQVITKRHTRAHHRDEKV